MKCVLASRPIKRSWDPGNANTGVQMQVHAPPSAVWELEVIHQPLIEFSASLNRPLHSAGFGSGSPSNWRSALRPAASADLRDSPPQLMAQLILFLWIQLAVGTQGPGSQLPSVYCGTRCMPSLIQRHGV